MESITTNTHPSVKAMMDERNYLKLSIKAEDQEECPHVDIVAVVDISGSMGGTAAGKTDGSTQYIDLGFSLLDLMKHALKATIRTLGEQDRLAIIVYDDVADVLFPLLQMDKVTQENMRVAVETLEGRNSTNIYNALKEAMKMVNNRKD